MKQQDLGAALLRGLSQNFGILEVCIYDYEMEWLARGIDCIEFGFVADLFEKLRLYLDGVVIQRRRRRFDAKCGRVGRIENAAFEPLNERTKDLRRLWFSGVGHRETALGRPRKMREMNRLV
jgi:hypothetical protein